MSNALENNPIYKTRSSEEVYIFQRNGQSPQS